MKTFTLDRKSWHYKLANWARDGDYDYSSPSNFCQYSRSVLWGVVFFFIIALVVCTFAALPVGFLVWLFQVVAQWGFVPMNGCAKVFVCLAVMVAVCKVGMVGTGWLRKWNIARSRRKGERGTDGGEPAASFISTLYQTTVGRFCLPIKMKDD